MTPRDPGVSRAELLAALIRGACLTSVVPLALAIVAREPLVRAVSFDGDLLRALMEVGGDFWARNPKLYDQYRSALRDAAAARRDLPIESRFRFWSPLSAES